LDFESVDADTEIALIEFGQKMLIKRRESNIRLTECEIMVRDFTGCPFVCMFFSSPVNLVYSSRLHRIHALIYELANFGHLENFLLKLSISPVDDQLESALQHLFNSLRHSLLYVELYLNVK
jgi:hypothetical protein